MYDIIVDIAYLGNNRRENIIIYINNKNLLLAVYECLNIQVERGFVIINYKEKAAKRLLKVTDNILIVINELIK